MESPVFPDRPEDTTIVFVYRDGDLVDKTALNPAHASARVGESQLAVVRRFVGMGVSHILAGPDHILFVIGLILAGGTIRRLLIVVSAFTASHSVTLSMTALGIASLPSTLVEPVIALSVVAVGLNNVRRVNPNGEASAWIAFAFGFFHGFGFAGAMVEAGLPRASTGLSLFAFNSGVEFGQLGVVAAVVPVLAALHSRNVSGAFLSTRYAGGVIALAGTIWFVERLIP